jgi:ElaB/YqjD/DUF883 family membrane-anchored ribosome-binding protein
MDWDTIELNWERYRKLARDKWHKIPDAVLEDIAGKRERLVAAVERAYDVSLEQAERDVNRWSEEARRVGDALADRFARSRSQAAAEFRSAAGATSARVAEGRQRLADFRGEAGARGELAIGRTREQVRAHPAAAIALAVGIGMLLGQLLTRRR